MNGRKQDRYWFEHRVEQNMHWLHLTDIHMGKNLPQQAAAMAVLVRDVAQAVSHPCDFVFFTGDLTNSGASAEYEQFVKNVLRPLRQIPHLAHATFVAVPGNHDLDSRQTLPASWESFDDELKSRFFEESDLGVEARRARTSCFEHFDRFTQENGVVAPIVAEEVTKLLPQVLVGAHRVRIVLTTTCLLSHRSGSSREEQRLPCPIMSLRMIVPAPDSYDLLLVLGHHPIHWFLFPMREPFRSFLKAQKAVYLHGHEHTLKPLYRNDGLEAFGFGAAYPKSLDAPPSEYQNAFATCALGEDLAIHVAPRHWDARHGRWVQSTEVPSDLDRPSDILPGGYVCATLGNRDLSAGNRIEQPEPGRVIALGKMADPGWRALLARVQFELPQDGTITWDDALQCCRLDYTNTSGRHRLLLYQGHGAILSRGQVESANTKLDADKLRTFTIVTLGTLAEDAQTLYLQLKSSKPLLIVSGRDMAEMLFQTMPSKQRAAIRDISAQKAFAEFTVWNTHIFLLVVERRAASWFRLIDADGEAQQPAAEAVRELRATRPELGRADCSAPADGPGDDDTTDTTYREACYREFNRVKYAGFATIGLRLQDASLDQIYVPANAEMGGLQGSRLRAAVDEMLDGHAVDDALRELLEVRLRSQLDRGSTTEVGAARHFYQQGGRLLVMGDPGSGKTCFAKSEILEYSKPAANRGPWYKYHLPLFLSLAEVGRLFDSAGDDLIGLAHAITAKGGLPLTHEQLSRRVVDGRVAFFFDGLDEIVSIELRARVVAAIVDKLDTWLLAGNRVVITSRPAAANIMELPPTLPRLVLRGLTTAEMRTLAETVLAVRLYSGAAGITSALTSLSQNDRLLVDQLLKDCESRPGLGRLARNPLLLTLLTMTYANTGALAARRHKVYAEAVSTLVSVRNREVAGRNLAEADLRRRLGAVAVAILRDWSQVAPTRSLVRDVLRSVFEQEKREATDAAIDNFLQEVAEATGLLVLHGDGAADPVTFMHHSFLEYYAAVGLLRGDYLGEIRTLSKHGRWQEVFALLAGIVGETGDVTPIVAGLLSDWSAADRATLQPLVFALDCALETNVPPENVQQVLVDACGAVLRSGVGLADGELRKVLALRLADLYRATGTAALIQMLTTGIVHSDPQVVAAHLDVLGQIGTASPLPPAMIELVGRSLGHRESCVQVAAIGCLSMDKQFRVASSIDQYRKLFRGTRLIKLACVQAAEESVDLAMDVQDALDDTVRSGERLAAGIAARALLQCQQRFDVSERTKNEQLLRWLEAWQRIASPDTADEISIRGMPEDLDAVLSSSEAVTRRLGIRLLPWVSGAAQFVHDRLFDFVSASRDHQDVSAALTALRHARDAQRVITYLDVDLLVGRLRDPHRDVRVAAVLALADLRGEADTIPQLLQFWSNSAEFTDFSVVTRTLARSAPRDVRVCAALFEVTTDLLRSAGAGMPVEAHRKLEALLYSVPRLDAGAAPSALPPLLHKAIFDWRLVRPTEQGIRSRRQRGGGGGSTGGARDPSLAIRRLCVVAWASVVPIDGDSLRALVDLLSSKDGRFSEASARAATEWIRRFRRDIRVLVAMRGQLAPLMAALARALDRRSSNHVRALDDSEVRALRQAIILLEQVEVTQSELSASGAVSSRG